MKYFITSVTFTKDDGQQTILKVVRSCEDVDYPAAQIEAAQYLIDQAAKENNWVTPTVDNPVYEEITLTRWNTLMNNNLDPELYPTNFVEDFTIYTESNEEPIP